jgi:ribosomal protein S18 acetylase RimI-like enzyme
VSAFAIRPMTPADVAIAVGLARAEGWHDRTRFFDLVFRTATCSALVGEVDGRVVATGMATVNGRVGWLGGLMVDSASRRRGYGQAMTEELIRRLQVAGCLTLSLEATEAGRPMYERMGFRIETRYHQLESGHLTEAPEAPQGATLRPLEPADFAAIVALDSQATGEDRVEPLRVLVEMNGGWVLERKGSGRPEPALAGFLLPAERAYGAIVAPRFEDGLFLLDLHRSIVPEGGSVRAGIPHEHGAAWAELENRGWVETWQAPRMLLGDPIDRRPEWIWGQINSAMG